jgi:hypothetical protein
MRLRGATQAIPELSVNACTNMATHSIESFFSTIRLYHYPELGISRAAPGGSDE